MDAHDSASSESSYSGSESPERSNRWTGASSTWYALTKQERGLDASLVELRNRDLSIHLYNSFALKSSSRKYREAKRLKAEASPSRGSLGVDESDAAAGANTEDLAGKEWAPPKVWTAWPVPPEQVPREDERVGPDDEDEMFTFKRRDKERPSTQLEEALVGTALKFAKERWETRETASVYEDFADEGGNEMDIIHEPGNADGRGAGAEENHDDSSFEGHRERTVKESSEPPKERVIYQPVLSADDDRSRDLLQPSIRHTLSRLDSVLMALHHARQTCRQFASDSESSTDDERQVSKPSRDGSVSAKRPREDDVMPGGQVTGDESAPAKRPVGRPRKFTNLTSRPKPTSDAEQDTEKADAPVRTKKTRKGRPMKHYEALKGETHDEYLVRIARLQKKPLSKLTLSRPASSEPAIELEPPLEKGRKKPSKIGTRDWSEVLGSAALVGFPPDVIARTGQRCANLFGESMTMRELVENPAGAEEEDFLTTYKPEEIPHIDYESPASSQSSDEERADIGQAVSLKARNDALAQNNWPCPFESCTRHLQGFTVRSNLKRHLIKVHKMTDEEVDGTLDDTREMHGGVHVDGFLKPIKVPTGMRGVDKRQRKEGRWGRGHLTAGEESSVDKMDQDGMDFPSDD